MNMCSPSANTWENSSILAWLGMPQLHTRIIPLVYRCVSLFLPNPYKANYSSVIYIKCCLPVTMIQTALNSLYYDKQWNMTYFVGVSRHVYFWCARKKDKYVVLYPVPASVIICCLDSGAGRPRCNWSWQCAKETAKASFNFNLFLLLAYNLTVFSTKVTSKIIALLITITSRCQPQKVSVIT